MPPFVTRCILINTSDTGWCCGVVVDDGQILKHVNASPLIISARSVSWPEPWFGFVRFNFVLLVAFINCLGFGVVTRL